MPEPAANTAAGSGSSADAAYFTMAEDGSVTVNTAGRARRSLTVPAEINGRAVTRLCAETFRGCTALEEVTIQSAVTALPDGLFADFPALHTIILTQPDPAGCRWGRTFWPAPRRLPDPTARRQLHSLLPAVFLVCLR